MSELFIVEMIYGDMDLRSVFCHFAFFNWGMVGELGISTQRKSRLPESLHEGLYTEVAHSRAKRIYTHHHYTSEVHQHQ
jgi:hypothetical protein